MNTVMEAADPYPRLARLRAEDPVHFVPSLGMWVVLRHDDVKRLFSDAGLVTPNRADWEFYQPPPEGTYMRWVMEHSLFAHRPMTLPVEIGPR